MLFWSDPQPAGGERGPARAVGRTAGRQREVKSENYWALVLAITSQGKQLTATQPGRQLHTRDGDSREESSLVIRCDTSYDS